MDACMTMIVVGIALTNMSVRFIIVSKKTPSVREGEDVTKKETCFGSYDEHDFDCKRCKAVRSCYLKTFKKKGRRMLYHDRDVPVHKR